MQFRLLTILFNKYNSTLSSRYLPLPRPNQEVHRYSNVPSDVVGILPCFNNNALRLVGHTLVG